MKINNRQLLGLPVETVSRQALGKVCGWEIDVETHQIIKYEIKSNSLTAKLFNKTLFIASAQVVSISLDKMVVEDNVARSLLDNKEKKAQPIKDASPISMSKS